MREALGITASTNEPEVQVFLEMAEGCLGVLIGNSTIGAESQLSMLPSSGNGLPCQALLLVEVCQKELLICAYPECWRHHSCQARWI